MSTLSFSQPFLANSYPIFAVHFQDMLSFSLSVHSTLPSTIHIQYIYVYPHLSFPPLHFLLSLSPLSLHLYPLPPPPITYLSTVFTTKETTLCSYSIWMVRRKGGERLVQCANISAFQCFWLCASVPIRNSSG